MIKNIRSEKGSIMLETVAICMVLVICLMGFLEIFTIITTSLHIQKVAREGAREAAITADKETGKRKALDVAEQCLKTEKPQIDLYTSTLNGQEANVTCSVTVDYKYLKHITPKGVGGSTLHAEAIYPWHDET